MEKYERVLHIRKMRNDYFIRIPRDDQIHVKKLVNKQVRVTIEEL